MNFRFDPSFFDKDFEALTHLSHDSYGPFKGAEILGFGNRIKLVTKTKSTILYQWEFPVEMKDGQLLRPDKNEICQLYATIEWLFNYTFDDRFRNPDLTPNQSFSLYPMFECNGWIYPPLLKFLQYCPENLLKELNDYVSKETNRVYEYVWGKRDFLPTKIRNNSFYIKILDSSDRNFCMGDRSYKGMKGFTNHNADNPLDCFCLLSGILALNTFFRENEKL